MYSQLTTPLESRTCFRFHSEYVPKSTLNEIAQTHFLNRASSEIKIASSPSSLVPISQASDSNRSKRIFGLKANFPTYDEATIPNGKNTILKSNIDEKPSVKVDPSASKTGTEWTSINSVWDATEEEALESVYIKSILSPFWRILLLSNGSVTRHLQLLTRANITVDCFEMKNIGHSVLDLPADIENIRGPRLQRQAFLRDKKGVPLVYASSWWTADEVNGYLNDVQVPIWISLNRQKIEPYRNIKRLYIVHDEYLETVFGVKGPFWGRHYIFYNEGRPLTLIYEVFSPLLEKYSF